MKKQKLFDNTSRWYRETALSDERKERLVKEKLERGYQYLKMNQYWREKVSSFR
jgi:hypothetical protein